MFRTSVVLFSALPLLAGCALIGAERRASSPPDPSEAVYRAALADLSDCVIAPDPVIATRLAGAAASLQAETRPTNPDHFYMTDRVTAAAAHCAGALAR
ncbi:hypothetical protein HKCCSP123_14840 [Rhodobacterales bacterium HKCCSP123]|nr:hypothetical protein [Rhodobacterales bacterium HKCCSP123]